VALDVESKRAFVADSEGTIRAFETTEGKLVGEILSNPPTIEARLRALAEKANGHQQVVAKAETTAKEKAEALDKATKALAEAEKAKKQAVEIHQAAASGVQKAKQDLDGYHAGRQKQRDEIAKLTTEKQAAQADVEAKKQALAAQPEGQKDPAPLAAAEQKNKDLADRVTKLQQELDASNSKEPALKGAFEQASKTAGVAQARIYQTEDASPAARKALEDADIAAKDSAAAIELVKNELPKIKNAEKHWSAASINAHALEAAKKAEETTAESEGDLETYTAAIQALEPQVAALTAKREEQAKLAEQFAKAEPAAKEELKATIDALKIVIDREAASLRKLQDEVLAARASVEKKIPAAHQATAQAQQLKLAYEKARQ
jgi:chromosome segregation ATPase